MYSERFGKDVVITEHARQRMAERGIGEALVLDLVETGQIEDIDAPHLFIHKSFPGRHDNLVCAAAVEEELLVIKTVMVNWTLRGAT